MAHTFRAIDWSDLAIVDLTEKGVGVGIEAGYAHAQGKEIVTIAQRGADISATLRGISARVILYDTLVALAPLLRTTLCREPPPAAALPNSCSRRARRGCAVASPWLRRCHAKAASVTFW